MQSVRQPLSPATKTYQTAKYDQADPPWLRDDDRYGHTEGTHFGRGQDSFVNGECANVQGGIIAVIVGKEKNGCEFYVENRRGLFVSGYTPVRLAGKVAG
jgi:hypothetical protein